MKLRTLLTSAFISLTIFLSACSNSPSEIDAPNATSEVTMEIQEVPSDATEKPAFSANILLVVTSTVIAIDHKERLVTLKDEEGNPFTFTAGEEVRNLAQVDVGDTVTAEYMENFSIRVLEAKNLEMAAVEIAAMGRTEEGEKPGVAVLGETVFVLTVEEINLKDNTFKMKNAEGVVQEFTARNPENLKKVEEGDVVLITYTEGIAISVSEPVTK